MTAKAAHVMDMKLARRDRLQTPPISPSHIRRWDWKRFEDETMTGETRRQPSGRKSQQTILPVLNPPWKARMEIRKEDGVFGADRFRFGNFR